jgi:hypothetical protein
VSRPKQIPLIDSSDGRKVIRQGDELVIRDERGGEVRWPVRQAHTLIEGATQALRSVGGAS